MNMKTLLGTAAGLMVASGAYAADLPGEAAPVAVDYVKVCDAYGAGFFYIPGTETCLDISGRVRARVQYTNNFDVAAAADPIKLGDKVNFKADAQVKFDARSASDLGTVRSFFVLKLDTPDGKIEADDAFIQVGYVTVGKFGNAYGDVFYGDTGAIYSEFDKSAVGAQIMVNDIGGGFYVGAGFQGLDNDSKWAPTIWTTGRSVDIMYTGRVGINGQSWGGVDLSGFYAANNGVNNDIWGLKGTADLKLIDKLSARLVGTYVDNDTNNFYGAAGALKYQATDALAVYAGVGSRFWDKGKDQVIAQVGADYAFTPDLILTAEVNYETNKLFTKADRTSVNDDTFSGMLKLTRNW